MPRSDRRRVLGRRRPSFVVENLEERQMLSAAPVPTHLHARALLSMEQRHEAILEQRIDVAERHAAVVAHRAALHQASVLQHSLAILRTHRVHPSAVPADFTPTPFAGGGPPTTAFTPSQVRTAYGVNLLPNQGAGVTIAIVDVGSDPTIVADASTFSTQFGLPQLDGVGSDPKLTIVAQPGTPQSPLDGSPSDTTSETALDVEWAHAIAPLANILLVYSNSFSYATASGGGLLPAVQTAASTPGVVVVSTSYGSREFSGETAAEPFFATPVGANPNPVAFTFSTGDTGAPGSFPAYSPSVIAVGGTSLFIVSARGRYLAELGWGGGGGGVSSQYAAPAFQSSNNVLFSGRAEPDVSMIADPNTGVPIINTANGTGWAQFGGTSLASPVFAGIIALAQEQRITAGLTPLSSVQINSRMYAAYNSASYSTYFHDILVGNNGNPAGVGYDLATGIGSPKANTLVPLLAAP